MSDSYKNNTIIYDAKTGIMFDGIEERNSYYKLLNGLIKKNDIYLDNTLDDELFDLLKKINIGVYNKLETIPNKLIYKFINNLESYIRANNKFQKKEYETEDEIINRLLKKHKKIITINTINGTFYIYSKEKIIKKEIEKIKKFINKLIIIFFKIEETIIQNRSYFYYGDRTLYAIEKYLKLLKGSENAIDFKIKFKTDLLNNLYLCNKYCHYYKY